MRRLVVIMGVSGCGKSTVGRALAEENNWPFLEGDDLHPKENIDKMRSGVALDDHDRGPWIDRIIGDVDRDKAGTIVLACSALTPFIQTALKRAAHRDVIWMHLRADRDKLLRRMQARSHFMPPELLDSQFTALTVPDDAVQLDASLPLRALLKTIAGLLER